MKPQLPSQPIAAIGRASSIGPAPVPSSVRSNTPRREVKHHAASTASARYRKPPAYVYDLRIFALIGDEVVEVLWDQPVDDPTEILVRRIGGTTFQQPIHLLNDVQLLR
jgi:hypothetical protein